MKAMISLARAISISCIFMFTMAFGLSVTFQVNMNNETVDANGVHMAGSFQGWDPAATALSDDDGDGIYSIIVDTLTAGTTYEYKYINGNAWGQDETAFGGNRSVVIPDTSIVLPPYCFNSLILCTEVYITFNVDMSFETVSDAGVHIAGGFQGWDPAATELFDVDGDGVYSITLPQTSGETVEYKYINGDAWGQDETALGGNRSLTVGDDDMVLPNYCFNSLEPCEYDSEGVWVTFKIDMSFEIINFTDGIHIAGSFQGWDPSAIELSDDDDDMVYEVMLDILEEPGDTVEFKFINGDEWGEDENIGSNRMLIVPETATVLDAPCFGSSDPCPDPPASVDVTFVVDMQYEEVSVNGVHVAGGFQSWDPAASEMTDTDGDGKYEINFTFAPGEELQYKFINGNDWDSAEIVPDECVTDGNRTWVAPNFNRPYEVCYEMCETCPAPPVTKAVIFSVDMSEWLDEDGATGMPVFSVARGDQMQIRGGFNGWNCDDPADCEMTRTPGTNIFSLAATITDGPYDVQEYKYYMQHDASSIEIFESTYGEMYSDMGWEDSPQFGGANRVFTLGEDDGTGLLELELSGYYDLPAGAVITAGQEVDVTFTVDMTGADADGFNTGDTVSLVLKDKWLNYLQGLGDGSTHVATANGDGTYSVTVTFTGPFSWHMIYTWSFYDVDNVADIEEGGGFGFGRFRARYQHADADNDCAWGDYVFPMDEWQKDPPLPLEDYDPESVCISLDVAILYNGGFEDGITGWSPYPEANASYVVEMTGANIYGSDAVFEAYEGDYSLKQWGQYDGAENYGSFGQWLEVGLAGLEVGSQPTLSGMMFSHADDWIGNGVNSAYLAFYYYDDYYGMVGPGWEMTDVIDASSPSSEWLHREVTGTVPEGTVWVWAGVEYYQASNADNGSVYTDMLEMDVSDEVSVDLDAGLPGEFKLLGNFPNPFNPVTKLRFDIDYRSNVIVTIYNILGNEITTIQNGEMNPGRYSLTWNATNDQGKSMSTGMYLYKVTSDSRVLTGKMLLMK